MYELALCASIGGLSLGLQRAGIRTACYVEYNNYRIDVLVSRMRDGWLDNAPIWDDVTTFDGRPWCGRVDIISAGFPCQPFSVAGSRRGKEDERYLWPHILRVIRQVGPRYILLENVPGLLVGKPREQQPAPISDVLGDLATCGYDAEWQSIPAAAFGAPHVRDRVFIVAYPREGRWTELLRDVEKIGFEPYQGWKATPLDSTRPLITRLEQSICEPSVCGSNDGTPYRMDRLAAVGEAVIPQIGEYIGRCLVKASVEN